MVFMNSVGQETGNSFREKKILSNTNLFVLFGEFDGFNVYLVPSDKGESYFHNSGGRKCGADRHGCGC